MAVLPTRLLEWEFTAGVWTDIFADVVSISTRRGRNRESGAYETGQMVFVLRNDARKYDPDYAAGPYYGNLRPNRRVRFRATYNAITYPVFLGYVDRITQDYGGPNDATATVTVSDRFKILNRVELPASAYRAEVNNVGLFPSLWYHLDEPRGSTVAVNSGAYGPALNGIVEVVPLYTGTPQFGEAGLVVRDPGTALRAFGVNGTQIQVPTTAIPGYANGFHLDHSGAWAVEFWARAAAFGGHILFQSSGGDTNSGKAVYVTWTGSTATNGRMGLVMYNDAGTVYAVNTSTTQNTNETYHFVIRHDADHTLHILVNGVDVTQNAGGAGLTFAGTITPTGPLYVAYLDAIFSSDITIDELAVYTGFAVALPTAEAIVHNATGRTPWNGDTPGARLARVLALAGLAGADYSLDAGTTTLQSTDLGGTALAYSQTVEETEAGYLFVDRSGLIRFIGRDAAQTGAPYLTAQATLVDHVGGGVPYRASSADVDESSVITRATVSREGSIAVTHTDAVAVTEFGYVDETHEGLLHASDTYSLSYAQWIVSTHKGPRTRLGAVSLELPAAPATLYPAILGRELAERVNYKRQPQNVTPTISQDMRIESISHDTGAHYWHTSLQLSPFNLGEGGNPVGIWDAGLWDQSVWGF